MYRHWGEGSFVISLEREGGVLTLVWRFLSAPPVEEVLHDGGVTVPRGTHERRVPMLKEQTEREEGGRDRARKCEHKSKQCLCKSKASRGQTRKTNARSPPKLDPKDSGMPSDSSCGFAQVVNQRFHIYPRGGERK